jgi:hypothetical protein
MNAYERVFKTKTSQIAFTAFTISLLFTIVVFLLLSIGAITVQGQHISAAFGVLGPAARFILVMMFVIVFLLMWYILYLQYVREAEDVYSHLREKLLGNWIAEYDYSLSGPQNIVIKPKSLFKFSLNNDRKLQLVFDEQESLIFEDTDNVVSDIALRQIQGNKFALMFHYEGERRLKSNISSYLEPSSPNEEVAVLPVETMAILAFDEPSNSHGIVTTMSGEWFDLNGSLKRLSILITRIDSARRENKTFTTKIWELDREVKNIGAKMGSLSFTRMSME